MLRSLLAVVLVLPASAQSLLTSFEVFAAGPLTRAAGEGFQLMADKGHAEIDADHARTGGQCLHLLGGEERSVELRADLDGGIGSVRFAGERWTSRAPFALRMEGYRDGQWVEVWDGTREVVVGRSFKSDVSVRLDPPVDRLRLVATSPQGSGVLIDDLCVSAPGPARLMGVSADQIVRPVLLGKPWSPLMHVDVRVEGTHGVLSLDQLSFSLVGVDPELVSAVALFTGDRFRDAQRMNARAGVLQDGLNLEEGTHRFWFAVQPSEQVGLDDSFDARLDSLVIDGEPAQDLAPPGPPRRQRVGVALRDAGDSSVHTYRIPAMVITPRGTLIATYDIRYESGSDLPGHIDVGVQRSSDGGRTWSPMAVCMDMGEPHGQNGIGDPASLVDPATGRVFVFALWSKGNRAWNGSGPGLTPEETGQLMVVHSDDEGVTWSQPRNLTPALKDPEWRLLLQSPGNGIAMADGSLVCPAQYRDAEGVPWSTVILSKDHGETWTIGTGARADTTESRVVELPGGVLMLNMRDNRGGSRAVMVSEDLGQTWKDHASTRSVLVEPVCNAGLERGRDGRLWFMNPAVNRAPRCRMTLKASDDQGLTWPHALLLFEPTCAGYPTLVPLDGAIGALYEGGAAAHLIYERVRIEEVVRK